MLFTLQTKLEVVRGVVEDLQSLNKVLMIKEENADNKLKNSCQELNVYLFSNITLSIIL